MAATEPNWRRRDSFRLPNGQLIGPGCVRPPGPTCPQAIGGRSCQRLARLSGHLTVSRPLSDVALAEHRRCGEMESGGDGERVWMTCMCGAAISRTLEPIHRQ